MGLRRRLLLSAALLGAAFVAADAGVSLLLLSDGTFRGRRLEPYTASLSAEQRANVAQVRSALLARAPGEPDAFDAELGWTNRPSAGGPRHEGFDSLGARGNREYEPRPPAGVLRIASFGDSFTQCAQVRWPDTWQAQLEALEPAWEVINLGVNGYGTGQALLRYRRVGRGLGARVVCIGLMLDNLQRNVNRYKPALDPDLFVAVKPRFVLVGGELKLLPQPFATEEQMLAAAEDGSIAELSRPGEHWADPDLPALLWRSSFVRLAATWLARRSRDLRGLWLDRDGEPRRVTLAILETFHREALADGARAAPVLVWPPESELVALLEGGERYWKPGLLDELDARGIAWIDLSEPLSVAAGGSPQGVAPLYSGNHLSRAGNAVVAGTLRDWVRARGLAERPRTLSR